ncbi:MAG TPA: hypothetical protein DCY88_20015 [Cyanobacteria bacterium UBA11372]|nr:hypothetical protein [Cyanobacteria bacterium UBA11372]
MLNICNPGQVLQLGQTLTELAFQEPALAIAQLVKKICQNGNTILIMLNRLFIANKKKVFDPTDPKTKRERGKGEKL